LSTSADTCRDSDLIQTTRTPHHKDTEPKAPHALAPIDRHMTARKIPTHQRASFAARWRIPFEKKPAGVTPSASPCDCRLDLRCHRDLHQACIGMVNESLIGQFFRFPPVTLSSPRRGYRSSCPPAPLPVLSQHGDISLAEVLVSQPENVCQHRLEPR
jgi:hypothetical protein